MSWEDCGFKPGTINGPKKCPKQCSDCDGDHHFYATTIRDDEDDEDFDGVDEDDSDECWFKCRHCGVTAAMVDEDED